MAATYSYFKVPYGMSIYNLSIQLYGDASHSLDILRDNPEIQTIQDDLTGKLIKYMDPGLSLTNYFKSNSITLNTGYAEINNMETVRSFNNSFNFAFR